MSYLDGIDSVTGKTRAIARIEDVLGAPSPSTAVAPKNDSSMVSFLRGVRDRAPLDIKENQAMLIGAVIGAVVWRDHRLLGILLGASIGHNVPILGRVGERRGALCNLGVMSAAVLSSLSLSKHPAIGFGLGWTAAGGVAYAAGLC